MNYYVIGIRKLKIGYCESNTAVHENMIANYTLLLGFRSNDKKLRH